MNESTADVYIVSALSCGRDHTLALLANGKVIGWGGDGSGRVAPDTPGYCSTFKAPSRAVEVNLLQPLTAVAAGYGVSLGITAGAEVAVWGANVAGIGGRHAAIALATPQLLDNLSRIRAVLAGEFLFGAIDSDGGVYTWGLNSEGALGRPTDAINAGPGRVRTLPPAKAMALGKGYLLALTRDGALFAWGTNAAGQLGVGHLKSVATPAPAPLQLRDEIHAIAAGATHSMAVTAKGTVLTWGSNHRGQLGRPELPYATVPTPVTLPERIHAVAAGMHFSLALADSGNVYAWGWNTHGQLGLNDSADRRVPTRVRGLEPVRAIAAGETHAAALTAKALFGWGSNATGQIGTAEPKQHRAIPFFALA
ncbi:MAG: hypothetical protein ABIO63_06230 [Casimicrobiaceae bacterium]